MVVSTIKMTAHQFLELGEDPHGVRLELVDGEVAVTPSPMPEHSYVDRMLTIIVGPYIVANKLGELFGDVDTIFGEHDVRRPDLIYFRKDRLHLVGNKAMQGPPDLCVEIVSPSSSQIDREDKFKQYEAAKVANYWIVDPAKKSIEAFVLKRGAYVSAGAGSGAETVHLPPFGDLAIPLARLWRPKR